MTVGVGDIVAGFRLGEEIDLPGTGERAFFAEPLGGGELVLIRIVPLIGAAGRTPLAEEFQRFRAIQRPGERVGVTYGIDLRLGIEYLITPRGMRPPPSESADRPAVMWMLPRTGTAAAPAPAAAPSTVAPRRKPAMEPTPDDFDADMMFSLAETGSLPEIVPEGIAVSGSADDGKLRRRSACRWYRRMNPGHNFVLNIVFSGSRIRLMATDSLGVTHGERVLTLDPSDPVVTVEPVFPGCIVTPTRMAIDLTPERVVSRFWITPLVTSEMPDACVRVWHRERLIEELPTPTRVVNRTVAHLSLAAGLFWPAFQQFCDWVGWSPGDEIRNGFPLLNRVLDFTGQTAGTVLIAALFVGLALFFYRITRPVKAGQDEAELIAG